MTFHSIAARYADDPDDADRLAALAAERLAARLRRSGSVCVVCGRRFVAARDDAETCSGACREKKRYRRAKPDV